MGSHQAIEKSLHFLSNVQGVVLYSFWTELGQGIYVHGNIILVFRKPLIVGLLRIRPHL